jgi:hypothetical protein
MPEIARTMVSTTLAMRKQTLPSEIPLEFAQYHCRDSLLYKGSEDDDEEFELEVTGCAWNKRTKTRTMMMATRIRVKGSMVAVRLRLWGGRQENSLRTVR